ncbi:MAG: hypothetical protein ABIO04_12060 [Ferruginibacter sp.]
MKDKKQIAEQPIEDSDITPEEISLLDESIENAIIGDSNNLKRSKLDNLDEDGTPLNEKSSSDDLSGNDLDIPGAEDDDENELIGEEDEENNSYSQADTE